MVGTGGSAWIGVRGEAGVSPLRCDDARWRGRDGGLEDMSSAPVSGAP